MLPSGVLRALGAGPGDSIGFEIRDGVVAIHRAGSTGQGFHRALASTLAEWSSDEDERAFADR